jgi:hypothetical protein
VPAWTAAAVAVAEAAVAVVVVVAAEAASKLRISHKRPPIGRDLPAGVDVPAAQMVSSAVQGVHCSSRALRSIAHSLRLSLFFATRV